MAVEPCILAVAMAWDVGCADLEWTAVAVSEPPGPCR